VIIAARRITAFTVPVVLRLQSEFMPPLNEECSCTCRPRYLGCPSAAKRLRPTSMTVAAMIIGLLPVLWSGGTGADVIERIAAPMLAGS
jgi:hypothetical protein